jgi:redox-regulated HSP33 family molecular chaperone
MNDYLMRISLGWEKLGRMIADQEMTEVRCEFRGRRYLLTRKELMSVIERRGW